MGLPHVAKPVVGSGECNATGDGHWDGHEYLPQGTVGAVVLDRFGTICVATSTGGLTNKLPGRIGDTPTLGAGFWAEEWTLKNKGLKAYWRRLTGKGDKRAVGISGTGDGDVSCPPL